MRQSKIDWRISALYASAVIKYLPEFIFTIILGYPRKSNTSFWFALYDNILEFLYIISFVYPLLIHFYINHKSSKKSLFSFSPKDHMDALMLMGLSIGLHLVNNPVNACISSDKLEEFFEAPVNRLLPLKVSVYNDNNDDFQLDEDYYQSKYKNVRIHRVHIPKKKSPVNNADNSTGAQLSPNDCATTIHVQASSIEGNIPGQQLILFNENCQISEGAIVPYKYGFSVQNINDIDQNFICQSCHLVLREGYKLRCGHRQCKSCIDEQSNIIDCQSCSESSTFDQIYFDQVFQDQLECLIIICMFCDWNGTLKIYQKHLEENHSDKYFICPFCNEQFVQMKNRKHYLSKKHQLMLCNILRQLQSIRKKDNQQFVNTLSILSNDAFILENSIQQIQNEFYLRRQKLQVHYDQFFEMKVSDEVLQSSFNRMENAQNDYSAEILSLKEQIEDKQMRSFDGILKWKIVNVQEKLRDAQSERQKSIYSPEFYSSMNGYKMRARLFLNGINDARDNHMSIFFILMVGDYDAILEWPFHFKVKFSLITQNDQEHFISFFWPDIRSICFQRPRLTIDEAYGIEKFISLEEFRRNKDKYIREDAIFIRVELDFLSKPEEVQSDSGCMLLNDEQHTDTNDDDLMRKILFSMGNS